MIPLSDLINDLDRFPGRIEEYRGGGCGKYVKEQ